MLPTSFSQHLYNVTTSRSTFFQYSSTPPPRRYSYPSGYLGLESYRLLFEFFNAPRALLLSFRSLGLESYRLLFEFFNAPRALLLSFRSLGLESYRLLFEFFNAPRVLLLFFRSLGLESYRLLFEFFNAPRALPSSHFISFIPPPPQYIAFMSTE